MFLSIIKKVSLKKNVKKYLSKVKTPSGDRITTVNLLIDGIHFNETTKLIEEFIKRGIKKENIKALVLVKDKNRINTDAIVYFRSSDIGLFGTISKDEIKSFIYGKSDLFISYFKGQHADLSHIALKSNGDFKVGFFTEGPSVNHLSIDSSLSDYKLFSEEMFKYLKALNKI